MGIIDTAWHKITCQNCGNTEASRLHDKGSGWGGSSWESSTDFENFDVAWKGGGKIEPEVTNAVCKKCGGSAAHESRYSFNKPEGY